MTDPRHDALFDAIRDQRQIDPLVGARVGAQDIRERLVEALSTSQGVHVETLLAVVGALAGQATQVSLRARALAAGQSDTAPFQTIRTKDGRFYVIGEALSRALAADRFSLWSLAAGQAQQAGCSSLPDLEAMFAYGIQTLGSERFGRPQVPEQHQPFPGALNCLADLWPQLFPLVRQYCPGPSEWPILFGLVAQQVIAMGQGVIDPCIALQILMETAIANSKVILAEN